MNRISLENDILDFLKICNQFKVKYLVVGGFAVSIHGYPRSTKDLDVCIELSEDNALKMLDVIDEFGFSSLNLKKDDFLKKDFITQIGYPPLRIDILNDLDGVSFEEAWNFKKEVLIEKVPVFFIGYDQLLTVKKKSGRPQDLADIHHLEKKRNKNK